MLPNWVRDLRQDVQTMPIDRALTYLRLRLVRAVGMRSDRRRARRLRPTSILFVCHGNVMRSPVAAELLRARLGENAPKFAIGSAGTRTTNGRPPDPRAVAIARELGVSLEQHRSKALTPAMVAESDLICVMDYRNEADVVARFGGASRKTVLLGGIDVGSGRSRVIPDPYSMASEDVKTSYKRLVSAVEAMARLLES